MASWEITIPGRPVPKARPRVCKNGHAYTPERTKTAEEWAQWHIRQVLGEPDNTKIISPIFLSVSFQFSGKKHNKLKYHIQRPDLDNLIKLICDSLLPWLADDSIISKLQAVKMFVPNVEESTWIRIDELESCE
jgi:Holliday junction resolvase RusA-like endonuclease